MFIRSGFCGMRLRTIPHASAAMDALSRDRKRDTPCVPGVMAWPEQSSMQMRVPQVLAEVRIQEHHMIRIAWRSLDLPPMSSASW
jgi:hypothetical protein